MVSFVFDLKLSLDVDYTPRGVDSLGGRRGTQVVRGLPERKWRQSYSYREVLDLP